MRLNFSHAPLLLCSVVMVMVSGCTASEKNVAKSSSGGPTTVATDTVSRSPTGVPHLKSYPPAPSFGNLKSIDGRSISLSSLKGKVVILDFWATWCGPCRMTIPLLNKLREKYGVEGLEIVGITDETRKQVEPFAEQMKMSYTVVADPDTSSTWQQKYGIESLPTMFILDRQGQVRLVEQGLDTRVADGTEARLNELIPELLALR